jgi:hypothetical protein
VESLPMNSPTQRMLDALAVLEALKPYEETGWDSELFAAAWKKAQDEADAAIREWLKTT